MHLTKYILNKWVFSSCLSLACLNSFAGDMGLANHAQQKQFIIQAGGFWGVFGKNQDVDIRYLAGNEYTVDNRNPASWLVGLGYYLEGFNRDRYQLSYGINGFYLGQAPVKGTIIQERLYSNLSYRYEIQNTPIYLAAKANVLTNNPKYNFVLDAGIGPNFMHASQYHETPLTSYSIPFNNFSTHNSVLFSATAGIGIRLNTLFTPAPVECGYRFFYLGQGQLAIHNDQYNSALKTGQTFANALVCGLTL
jgi:hypothetical protein